jgi:hypothetical protein
MTRANTASEPDVCAEAIDEPFLPAARVASAQSDHVPEAELDHSGVFCRH